MTSDPTLQNRRVGRKLGLSPNRVEIRQIQVHEDEESRLEPYRVGRAVKDQSFGNMAFKSWHSFLSIAIMSMLEYLNILFRCILLFGACVLSDGFFLMGLFVGLFLERREMMWEISIGVIDVPGCIYGDRDGPVLAFRSLGDVEVGLASLITNENLM